jgi:two-component system sensor histidine kinase KdpD
LQGRRAAAGANGRLHYPREARWTARSRTADLSIAQWVVDHGKRAGLGSDTLPAAPALYVPLSDERQRLGVLAVLPENRRRVQLPSSGICWKRSPASSASRWSAQRCGSSGAPRVAAETESLAQHAARIDLARPAHTAGGDCGREQHAG